MIPLGSPASSSPLSPPPPAHGPPVIKGCSEREKKAATCPPGPPPSAGSKLLTRLEVFPGSRSVDSQLRLSLAPAPPPRGVLERLGLLAVCRRRSDERPEHLSANRRREDGRLLTRRWSRLVGEGVHQETVYGPRRWMDVHQRSKAV